MSVHSIEIETPRGRARIHVEAPPAPVGTLVLGHGAGGGVDAPDLLAACEVALELGLSAVRVEQPYLVAGKRAPAPTEACCEAWVAVVEQLREAAIPGTEGLGAGPLIVGGRSMGARIACRTAGEVGADGVLCLAFPLQPGPRKSGVMPPGRQDELNGVAVPTLVVQGVRDAFGMPRARSGAAPRKVVRVAGDHGLKADHDAVRAAIREWLAERIEI